MASVNKVIIVGNIGKDPEIKYMADGRAVTNLSVATSTSWKDKNTGEKKEETEWHRVVAYAKIAEIISDYCKKGGKIYIEGRLKTRKWQDQNGVEKYATEIIADQIQLLGNKEGGNTQSSGSSAPARQQQAAQSQSMQRGAEELDDDITF